MTILLHCSPAGSVEAPEPSISSQGGSAVVSASRSGALTAGPGRAVGSRAGSLLPGASMDLALLELASSASADLRFRRAESLLPCGLTTDEARAAEGWERRGVEGVVLAMAAEGQSTVHLSLMQCPAGARWQQGPGKIFGAGQAALACTAG